VSRGRRVPVNPYRTQATLSCESGPRWGATPWVKFWVSHPRLEKFAFFLIIVFVLIPVRVVTAPFTGQHPLDF
jgi:hypothetical protein